MTNQSITRAGVIDWMTTIGQGNLKEQRGHDWRLLNTAIVDQGSFSENGVELGFHLIEVCLSGQHRGTIHTALEQGDRADISILPGSVGYGQAQARADIQLDGNAKFQELYVDDSVFKAVCSQIAPGDPDNVVLLGFQGSFIPRLKFLLDCILEEGRQGAPGGELYADLLAQQVALTLIRRRLKDAAKKPVTHSLSDEELALVVEFMEANLEEVGGLDALSDLIDMDVFSFSRGFKARTGQAPHQFLIERRLNRVKDLLLHSNERLVDITYATGFSNQAHMTAAFSKHFGMPPGAWRKMVRT